MLSTFAFAMNIFSQGILVLALSLCSIYLLLSLITLSSAKISLLNIENSHCELQRIQLWIAVLSPWLCGILCTVLIGLSNKIMPKENILSNILHWHHPYDFSWSSWHGVSIIISLIVFALLLAHVFTVAHKHIQQDKRSRTLLALSKEENSQFDHDLALAYTSGLFFPRAYISSGLASKLSKQELDIVSLHEQGHVNRYDPLQKWLFLFFASFYPTIFANRLISKMNLVMEYSADQYSSKTYDSLTVAGTLVKVSRIIHKQNNHKNALSAEYLTGIKELEKRINYLLLDQAPVLPALIVSMAQLLLPPTISILSLDFLHHGLDQWLWH